MFHLLRWSDKSLTNSTTTLTELVAASDAKVSASLDWADPPPAKSERALKTMNGTLCCKHIRATDALSMSTGLTWNLL